MTNKEILEILKGYRPQWCDLGWFHEGNETAVRYFCTPKEGQIFASMGVDGIHFCTIPNLGEYVFVVNPMALDNHYVLPVAKDMAEFVSLVITLHGTQLIDQMVTWDKETFEAARADLLVKQETERLRQRQELMELFPVREIDDPYGYVHALCDRFNPKAIVYTEEYYATIGLTSHEASGDDFVSIMTIRRK